ncbi:metallophosphoesterase [Roseateles sp.]|uniref:metallophosphoesterase n=1 Tax=Roseateles sp. TaxID=1971397 RepID=UPI0032637C7A
MIHCARFPSPSFAVLTGLLAALLAVAGCTTPSPAAPPPAPLGLQQAWVQAVAGPGWVVRALTGEACPTMRWAGASAVMQERSAPGDEPQPPGKKQPAGKPTSFTLRACEAPFPADATSVQVGAITLNAPKAEPRRIVVIGDTGCRLKASGRNFQPCNDPAGWAFPRVLARALVLKPDLVIHVGDYHYRESPCPSGMAGCAQSPWGYGDDTWQADFFRPATALLAAAPWVFVRGNHEACSRAGQGWLRYLDAETGPARACAQAGPGLNDGISEGDFTAPFAVPLSSRSQLIVFDSSEVGDATPPVDSPAWARWRQQLDRVTELASQRAQSLFLSHHPSLAYSPGASGKPGPARSGLTPLLQDAFGARLFPPGVQATLHGHLHIHQVLGFASNQPASLVIGNGGSATTGRIDTRAALAAEPLPGASLETFQSHAEFGFTLLTATPQGWLLRAFDTLGQPLTSCSLAGQKLRC